MPLGILNGDRGAGLIICKSHHVPRVNAMRESAGYCEKEYISVSDMKEKLKVRLM